MVQKLENLRQSSKTSTQNCIGCGAILAVSSVYRECVNETSSPCEPVTLKPKNLGDGSGIGALKRQYIQML